MTSQRNGICFGLVCAMALTFFCFPSTISAEDENQGASSATFLKLDPNAKSAALGSASLGKSGVASAYFNPAGLGFLSGSEALATQNDIFAGITYRYLGLAYPSRYVDGGVGFSLTSMDFGTQQRTKINNDRPIVSDLGDFGANDLVFTTSYGKTVTPDLSLGVSLKYLRSEIAGFSDGTFSGDLGIQYLTPLPRFRLGVAGRNVFGQLQLNKKEDPLPRVYEIGGNYMYPVVTGSHEISLGFGAGIANDGDEYFFSGIEYDLYRIATFRVGHRGEQEADEGFTFGSGIRYGSFSIDYAYVPFGNLGRQQRFSLKYAFGGRSLRQKKQQREETTTKEISEPSETKENGRSNWRNELDQVKSLHNQKKYKKAYNMVRKLSRSHPQNVDILLWLGLVEYKLGNAESAKKRMKKVLEIKPDNSFAQSNLKLLKEETNNFEDIDALLTEAKKLFGNERFSDARQILDEGLEKQPRNPELLYWLGKTKYRLGKKEKAKESILTLLEIDPDNDRAQDLFLKMK